MHIITLLWEFIFDDAAIITPEFMAYHKQCVEEMIHLDLAAVHVETNEDDRGYLNPQVLQPTQSKRVRHKLAE